MAEMPFSLETEEQYIRQGLITRRKHPEMDLWILNYTQKCVVEHKWDNVTLTCRGIIYNPRRRIVARPFPKFFNLEELKGGIPNGKFYATDKADGSLGISYLGPDGKTCISTRGSFESEQAIRGTALFRQQYPGKVLMEGVTYLFEIVYPENRYVIDYGGFSGLILLAAIEINSGIELDITEEPLFGDFIKIERYNDLETLDQVRTFVEREDRKNTEGVVLLFRDGTRVKIKSSRYLEVFGIISGWNKRNVWESLSSGSSAALDLLEDDSLPEEFQIWIKNTTGEIQGQFEGIMMTARDYFEYRPDTESRKRLAEYFSKFKYPAILFALLDEQPDKAEKIAWQLVKP